MNSWAFGMFWAMCQELMAWNHHVVHPIEDEGRLLDFTQVCERCACVEFGQVVHVGFNLRLYHCGRTGRVLVRALMAAFPEGASGLLRGFGAAEEENRKSSMVGTGRGAASSTPGSESGFPPAWTGSQQHELANQIGVASRQVLGLKTAQREAQNINLLKSKRSYDGCRVVGHMFNAGARRA
jgi:hypothetical protein